MYTELQTTTAFSFLRGASHPEELIDAAVEFGYTAIGITDENSLAGVVRAHAAAKKKGIRIVVGCQLHLTDGPSLLVYPTDTASYSRLTNLLTTGNLRAEKGECILTRKDVYGHAKGLKFIAVSPSALTPTFELESTFTDAVKEYCEAFGNNVYIGTTRRYAGDDAKLLHRLSQLSSYTGAPMVATNDVHYHEPTRRQLQDVLTCIREKCTIHTAGYQLHPNAERYLKSADEMRRLFLHYPDAIAQTQEIAEACQFSLDSLKYEYPEELTTEGRTPQEELAHLTWQGAKKMFGDAVPEKTTKAIRHELAFIDQMNYAAYFLTVYDIVRYARSQKILCQGRGSAANSTVCFCLGITSVNPENFDLLFERFLSASRNEPPDIDVDFEHERREEVIQYIYNKYGRDRAAIVATVTQQHQKGAIRDVAKAMGLSVDTVNRISGSVWHWENAEFEDEQIINQGLDPKEPYLKKVLQLTHQYMGFPRQLGQHTGGFVITRGKLSDLCPIHNARMPGRTCIEWNKDDIDALGFLKIDVLALGMLTCIRKAFDLAEEHYGKEYTLANIEQDDKKVYDMISNADTIGVFQIESRAQQAMLPRLRPNCFYDLVIEVAIVRPGPIQGDMVHPYLRRRNGEEEVEYPSEDLENILKRTLGVPLFQEQAMKIAIVAAGFTPTEADELRRSMATFRAKGMVKGFHEKLVNGMMERKYTKEYAERVFKQLEGFGSYGFPESHAASFALLVYVSSWLKCYHPDVFACALLNSMPMGFYQPAQIVIDAQNHSVHVRPVDVNHSRWDNTLEEKVGEHRAMRLGFRQVKGLREEETQMLIAARRKSFITMEDVRRTGISEAALQALADADAFRSIALDRREAFWEAAITDRPTGLFDGQRSEPSPESKNLLPLMTPAEHVVQDYAATSLSIKAHPVSFVREKLMLVRAVSISDLELMPDGAEVKLAGLVLIRQRPGTAKGVWFVTVEDETGTANLVVFKHVIQAYRQEILQARLLMVEGKMQREGLVTHVIAAKCHNLTAWLDGLSRPDGDGFASPVVDVASDSKSCRKAVEGKPRPEVFDKGRNFR